MIQLDEIAARDVLRLRQILGVLVLLTVAILRQSGGHIGTVAFIEPFIRLLHIRDGHRSLSHGVLLAEEIDTAVLPIIVEVDPIAACGIRKPQLSRQILDELIVHLCGIEVAGQQHPRLDLLLLPQQIAGLCQLDLIGLLGRIGKGGVAPRLQLRQAAIVDAGAICSDQLHLRILHHMALVRIDIGDALIRGVLAGQIQCREFGGLHHTEGQGLFALTHGSGDLPIAVRAHGCHCGNIHSVAQISHSLVSGKHDLMARGLRSKGQRQLRHVRGSRQEEILGVTLLCKGDLMTVHGSRHRGDIRRCGIRPRIENIRPLSTIVHLVVFRRNFRAASRHKVVAHIRSQAGYCKGRLFSGSHGLSAAVVLVAPRYLVVPRAQGRRPT